MVVVAQNVLKSCAGTTETVPVEGQSGSFAMEDSQIPWFNNVSQWGMGNIVVP